MRSTKKLAFCLLFAVFFAFLHTATAAEESNRYFVKSTKGFWKNALGVRHVFDNGFTTDASDFQLRLAKVFGVGIELVPVLQILPADSVPTLEPSPSLEPDVQPSPTVLGTEIPSVSPKPNDKSSDNPTESKEPSKTSGSKTAGKPSLPVRSLPSDPTPWGIEAIYNNALVASTSGGANVNVAVLDTGVMSSHLDLKSRVSQCKDFTNLRYPVLDGKCEDKNGHGTHVAGIIAADAGSDGKGIYGVAPESKLFAYKVCGSNGSCYADDIAMALHTAADQGANIINMSFGSDQESPLIKDAVKYAYSKGVLMVAAAGNDGPFSDSIDYPAAYSSVVAVGAMNKTIAVTDWSSHGNNSTTTPWVVEDRDIEVAAPGEYIESTWNNGSYVLLSGTSMASPFIAGLAAKYWQSSSANPASASRNFIHSLAKDLLPVGDDDASGFGFPSVK